MLTGVSRHVINEAVVSTLRCVVDVTSRARFWRATLDHEQYEALATESPAVLTGIAREVVDQSVVAALRRVVTTTGGANAQSTAASEE